MVNLAAVNGYTADGGGQPHQRGRGVVLTTPSGAYRDFRLTHRLAMRCLCLSLCLSVALAASTFAQDYPQRHPPSTATEELIDSIQARIDRLAKVRSDADAALEFLDLSVFVQGSSKRRPNQLQRGLKIIFQPATCSQVFQPSFHFYYYE